MAAPNLQRCIKDALIRRANLSHLGTMLSYFQNQNRYKQELGMKKTGKTSEDRQNKRVQRNPADPKVGTGKVERGHFDNFIL